MKFTVHELPKAKADKRSISEWLFERSPQGAASWLDAYDRLLVKLEGIADLFGEAIENQDCEFDVKQAFFKTKHGRVYRILYFLDGNDVYILRVRGPGQAPIDVGDR